MPGVTAPCPFCNAAIDPTVDRCPWCDNPVAGLVRPGSLVAARFEVASAVASGPLGVLYRARDHQSQTLVLLRRVADELLPGFEERGAFVHQVQTFVGRSIAGCAMPIACVSDERAAWVAAPYVSGASLRSVLDAMASTGRAISLEESLRVLAAVASAMAAMHAVTAHGALWPDHVMITARGIVLTDGALASAVAPERWQPRLAQFADVSKYVAPEVAGRKKVTATADLFAFGAIAAELIAGEPTFAAVERAGHLSDELKSSVRVLHDRDRTRRAGGAGQLLEALARTCGFDRRPADVPNPVGPAEFGTPPMTAMPSAPSPSADQPAAHAPPPVVRGAVSNTPVFAAQAPAPRPGAASPPNPTRPPSMPPPPSSVVLSASSTQPTVPGAAPATPKSLPPMPAGLSSRGPDVNRIPRGGLPGQSRGSSDAATGPASSSGAPMPLLPKIPAVPATAPRMPTLPSVPGLASPGPRTRPNPTVPTMSRATAPSATREAAPAQRSAPAREKNLDDIDPRLLRAARKLQAERDTSETLDEADLEEVD